MDSPQLENGYTRIANELLDALAGIRIPGEARQVLDVIIRKTYGFGKKWDAIPLSQFVKATGLKRPNVVRAVIKLDTMGIIKKDTGTVTKYMFNKRIEDWKPLSKKIQGVSKTITRSIVNDNESLSKTIHSKETTKETIQKKDMCPRFSIKDFVDLYHQELPFGRKIKVVTKTRQDHIRARLRTYPDKQFWIDLFAKIKESKFLCGEIDPKQGFRQFQISLDFITNENRIADILEGKYGKVKSVNYRELPTMEVW